MRFAFTFLAFTLVAIQEIEAHQYWTSWLDRDNPSGKGDYETYNSFSRKPCNEAAGYKPVQAECRIKSNRQPWYTANKVISLCYACTVNGIACVNQKQGCGIYQVCCPDYEVRFLCYKV